MAVVEGVVQSVSTKVNSKGGEYLLFEVMTRPESDYTTKVYDHNMAGSRIKASNVVKLEVDESEAPQGGKFRNLRDILSISTLNTSDDEDDGPDLTDAEYEVPAITPQEPRSGPVEPAFNGLAWGACQNNATTIVTSADYIKPSFLSEEEKRSWYTGEILTMAMLLYQQRPS